MKRILVIGSIAALATIGFAGSANAAPNGNGNSCFGGIHKTINTEGFGPYTNVSQVVQEFGGPGKNALAQSLCS